MNSHVKKNATNFDQVHLEHESNSAPVLSKTFACGAIMIISVIEGLVHVL